MSDEARQERVCCIDRTDPGEPQFLHQAILKRMMRALDAALSLACIGAENLDVEFRQSPPELGHSITADRVLVRHPKDGMLVGVEGDRFTVATKIGLQRLEIGERAVCTENSNPDVMMVKPSEDRV